MKILKTLDFGISKYLEKRPSGYFKTRDKKKAHKFKIEEEAKEVRNTLLNGENYSIVNFQ